MFTIDAKRGLNKTQELGDKTKRFPFINTLRTHEISIIFLLFCYPQQLFLFTLNIFTFEKRLSELGVST